MSPGTPFHENDARVDATLLAGIGRPEHVTGVSLNPDDAATHVRAGPSVYIPVGGDLPVAHFCSQVLAYLATYGNPSPAHAPADPVNIAHVALNDNVLRAVAAHRDQIAEGQRSSPGQNRQCVRLRPGMAAEPVGRDALRFDGQGGRCFQTQGGRGRRRVQYGCPHGHSSQSRIRYFPSWPP